MKLNAHHLSALDDGGECFSVLADGNRVRGDWRCVAVGEIYLGALGHAVQQDSVPRMRQAVPANVRDLQSVPIGVTCEPLDRSGEQSQAEKLGRLFAAFVQPLHSEADAEQWMAHLDARKDGPHP